LKEQYKSKELIEIETLEIVIVETVVIVVIEEIVKEAIVHNMVEVAKIGFEFTYYICK
jgi:hypothetical protein